MGSGDLLHRVRSPQSAVGSLICGLRTADCGHFGGRELGLDVALVVQLVQALGEALGAAAAVDEDDRGGVLAHEAQQLRVDGGPDRAWVGDRVERGFDRAGINAIGRNIQRSARLLRFASGGGRVSRRDGPRTWFRHVVDRDDDLQVELLAHAGVHDLALALRPDQELGDPLERALSRGKPDALGLRVALVRNQMREPLERQRQMGAALRLGDGVDLVDDHRLDPGQHLARLRSDDQIQRFRRRDQDVGRVAPHRLALALRRVAGAQGDAQLGADAPKRRPQVALDVVGERLQGRDVDDLHPGPELLRDCG